MTIGSHNAKARRTGTYILRILLVTWGCENNPWTRFGETHRHLQVLRWICLMENLLQTLTFDTQNKGVSSNLPKIFQRCFHDVHFPHIFPILFVVPRTGSPFPTFEFAMPRTPIVTASASGEVSEMTLRISQVCWYRSLYITCLYNILIFIIYIYIYVHNMYGYMLTYTCACVYYIYIYV